MCSARAAINAYMCRYNMQPALHTHSQTHTQTITSELWVFNVIDFHQNIFISKSINYHPINNTNHSSTLTVVQTTWKSKFLKCKFHVLVPYLIQMES